jgi:hypothetical protein
MKKTIYALGLGLLGFQAAAMAALQESNTVPSKQLITDLAVIKSGGESDVSVVPFLFKAAEREGDGPTLLTISADETITFSVGNAAVVCKQDQNCRLPFVKDAIYNADVKRPNGETFHSQIKLPQETSLTGPAENFLFRKNEDIQFDWTPSRARTRGIALSTFLSGLNCDTTGSLIWEKDFSATVPAGYVGSCDGPVKARFTVFYVDAAVVPGVAGGVLKGYAVATRNFTFVEEAVGGLTSVETETQPLSAAELREMLLQEATKSHAREVLLKN